MASVWYTTIPCTSQQAEPVGEISVTPQPADRDVMITIRREKGRTIRVRLAPGWARVFADQILQSALQVQYKPPAPVGKANGKLPRAA